MAVGELTAPGRGPGAEQIEAEDCAEGALTQVEGCLHETEAEVVVEPDEGAHEQEGGQKQPGHCLIAEQGADVGQDPGRACGAWAEVARGGKAAPEQECGNDAEHAEHAQRDPP